MPFFVLLNQEVVSVGKIGILVHGRHVEAVNWEQLVWGIPPDKMGSLPKMLQVILQRGVSNIGAIVFGTGASQRDGVKEAVLMKELFMWHMGMELDVRQFGTINRLFPKAIRDQISLNLLLDNIICETTSQNTVEEIAAAAKIFAGRGITEVIQVTCGSHAPRCLRDMIKARHDGLIPADQIWSVMPDDMTYFGPQGETAIGDVVILEPPHRGDDPTMEHIIHAYQVVPRIFRVPAGERPAMLSELFRAIQSRIK